MMINLINVAYCAMKLLPYQDESFSDFRDKSVQDFRFALSEGIRQQVFFATFVKNIEIRIKSSSVINALKRAIVKQEHYFIKLQSGVNKIPSVIIPWQIRMIKKVNSNSLFQTKKAPSCIAGRDLIFRIFLMLFQPLSAVF